MILFISQRTAEYPAPLAASFAEAVCSLFPHRSGVRQREPCSLCTVLRAIPAKPRTRPPTAAQDGGGIYSLPDWSDGPRYHADQLRDLRQDWQRWLLEKNIPARLHKHVADAANEPLFDESESAWLQASFRRFSDAASASSDWDFAAIPGQPYCLSALERLGAMLGDRDTRLFPSLRQGVPTGFDDDIPRSHTLRPRRVDEPDVSHELLICEGNWQGAESDPALLQELIEEEATAGFLEELPSLEAAFARWGRERVAVGKVNIVKAPGRAAHTNQNCNVPEQFSLPSLQDIQAAYPLREDSEPVAGFSLDVKGAHKTALVRESDRGLLGQRQQERLFFDRVCPFGAIVSHSMSTWDIQISRCGHLVKSRLSERTSGTKKSPLWQNEKVLPLGATLILAFCSCFQIPLSWRKLQLGPAITWIGWGNQLWWAALLCSRRNASSCYFSFRSTAPQTFEPQTA